MSKVKLEIVADVLVCGCVGVILDYFLNTSIVCSILGLLVGTVIALIAWKRKK